MKSYIYLLERLEESRPWGISKHVVSYNSLGKWLGATRFTDDKQWNPQLNTYHHHEYVFAQGRIASNVIP